MDAATITPLTIDELTAVGISAIIAKAAVLSRDPELNPWMVYESAKKAICEMSLPAADYESAIARLAEALRI